MKTPALKKKSPLLERHLVVRDADDVSLPELGMRLLAGRDCESGFVVGPAPVPPKFDTRLLVLRKGRELMICALLPSSKRKKGAKPAYDGSVEILFDLRNDGFGFTQFVFQEGGIPFVNEFAPYPETKSTAAVPLRVRRWGYHRRPSPNTMMFASAATMFFAVFDEPEIFRHSATVGFNVCRTDRSSNEFSSWSFMAGNGAPDANSLGKLHRDASVPRRPRTVAGLPEVDRFRVSITNDSPMVIVNRHYTPASLDAEMQGIKSWGVNRLHWIDYSHYPSFWAMPFWRKQYAETIARCGDLLAAACRAARKHKVELVPDFKIFDLGFTAAAGTGKQKDAYPLGDGADVLCIPEMRGNADAFMQTNPAWRRKAAFPIHTLRLYSTEPLPAFPPAGLKLSQSADNSSYRQVRLNGAKVSVRKVKRPNRRWTPAGIAADAGSHAAWMIEITGLAISQPFVCVEIPTAEGRLFNRHFALVEAVGRDGSEAPFLCSDAPSHLAGAQKFDFLGKWPAWNNYNDHAYGLASLDLKAFGIALFEPPALAGMLEPAHPVSRKIWLDRVDNYLEHDVAGISIRTLCHHRRSPSWLQYAFSPAVIDRFRKVHGRDPRASEEDYRLVRLLRGEALGDFLAEAAARIRRKKKKSIFQVESGGELPAGQESRMAIFYDYEKWISSGLFDELHVRAISAHSPWLRQTILPLARKYGVEVHIMTRNHAEGFGPRDLIETSRIVSDAKSLGYHGLNFYESANLYELTDADTLMSRAMGALCVQGAVQVSQHKPA